MACSISQTVILWWHLVKTYVRKKKSCEQLAALLSVVSKG